MDRDLLVSAESGPLRRGKKELIKHLEGGKITRKQAMLAKCYDCDGMGDSGKCDIETCPMYHYSQFKSHSSTISTARSEKNAIQSEVSDVR